MTKTDKPLNLDFSKSGVLMRYGRKVCKNTGQLVTKSGNPIRKAHKPSKS